MLLSQLFRPLDHAAAALGGWRQNDLRAQRPHQFASFDGERLDHAGHERVALGRADHGQRDAGIARSCLDHRLPGLEVPTSFGIFNDRNRQAVLDRAQRIEELGLDVQIHMVRCQTVDPDNGRVADGGKNIGVNHDGDVRCNEFPVGRWPVSRRRVCATGREVGSAALYQHSVLARSATGTNIKHGR